MACPALPEMPNGPILELHGQRKRFSVPFRLKGLLEDMTREVLRSQPKSIYQFIGDLVDQRILERDVEELKDKKEKRPSWEWKRWSWQGSSKLNENELKEFLSDYNVDRDIADALANTIQSAYRGYKARNKYKNLKKEFHLRLMKQGDPFADLTIAHHRELERLLTLHKIKMENYPNIGFAIADHPEAMRDLLKSDSELHTVIKDIFNDFLNNIPNDSDDGSENEDDGEDGFSKKRGSFQRREGSRSRRRSSGKASMASDEMEGELDEHLDLMGEKDESEATKPIIRASLLKNREADGDEADEDEDYEVVDLRPETEEE